jgi:phosphatidylglycerol:prolipoprotein diacylglycerol transferase
VRPDLVTFTLGTGEVTLRAYSTFYALAFVLSPLVAAWVAGRRGLPKWRSLAVCAGALAIGVVGGRLLDLFVAGGWYADDPSRVWRVSFSGFSLYGGLTLATLAAIALARAVRLPVWRLADSAVAGLVVGLVLMRVGCFLNGCCFGEITDVPWGVVFQPGTPAWAHQLATGAGGVLGTLLGTVKPVHPTQLYEMAGTLVCGAVAWVLARRKAPDGVPFLAFALGFTLVRFGNNFLRARVNTITAPTWFYPVVYSALAAILVAMIVWRLRGGRERP